IPQQVQTRNIDATSAHGDWMPVLPGQFEPIEMVEVWFEAGAPDDDITAVLTTVGPRDPSRGQSLEHRRSVQVTTIACSPNGRDHDDIAEARHTIVVAPGPPGRLAGGGDIEEDSSIDVIRHEPWSALRHPQCLRHGRDFRDDLRGGVPTADDDDPLVGE